MSKKIPIEAHPISDVITHLSNIEYIDTVGSGVNRQVFKLGESGFCLKIPHKRTGGGKNQIASSLLRMNKEVMMYEVSQKLGFNVVPFTKLILKNSPEFQHLVNAFSEEKKKGIFEQSWILQRYVVDLNKKTEFDLDNVQKVLLFNWLTGRGDQIRVNSAINLDGKVFEIDNEIGFNHSKTTIAHWLMTMPVVKGALMEKEVIPFILHLPEQIHFPESTLSKEQLLKIQNQIKEKVFFLKTAILEMSNDVYEMMFVDFLKKIVAVYNKRD